MLGDSGGFVDPVFSSGMLLAMDSAYKLVDVLEKGEALSDYESAIKQHLQAWFEIVSYYYNGRLMTAINVGDHLADNFFNRLLTPWISGHVSRIFSGAAGSKGFSLSLLRFLVKYGLKDKDPRYYEIK
jgi:flavin-dependent dehydrogenase